MPAGRHLFVGARVELDLDCGVGNVKAIAQPGLDL
jgi:hypothetical protein